MGYGSGVAMSCGVGRRHSSDLALLWLWCRPSATALIRHIAWEPPHAADAALKRQKKKKKEEAAHIKPHHKYFLKNILRHSLVAQKVKDLVVSLQQLRSLLWYGFNPWPGNFHMPQVWPKKMG